MNDDKNKKKPSSVIKPITVDTNNYGVRAIVNARDATNLALYLEFCLAHGDIIIREGELGDDKKNVTSQLFARICEAFVDNDVNFVKWRKQNATKLNYDELKAYFAPAAKK